MTLQIQTFDDLLKIINTHPEWRRQLVKALFPEVDFPKALQELTESNRLWHEELQAFRLRQEQMETRQEQMEQHLVRIDDHLARLGQRQDRMDGRLTNVERSVADLKSFSYENDIRIRSKANAIFGYLLRRGHDARNEISQRLDAAEAAGLVTGEEYTQVLASDLLWSGQLKSLPVVAACECSESVRQEAKRRDVVIVKQFSVDRSTWKFEPA